MVCEVSRRGQAIRLNAPGWKNVARMDEKLGQGYSEDEIRAVLAGEKEHTPRKKPAVQTEPPKVNLLVDIQAKLQAGYFKKFLAEHEADILLHKAAKQAFADLDIKKLTTVKSLQAEYATLLEEKKKDYAEYRRSREEMRELLTAKANVDRLMGYGEERQNDREKEQGQNR